MSDVGHNDDRLDELLRAALEPDEATVRRVARAALAAPPRRSPRFVWAAAAAAVLLAAVALLALAPWFRPASPPEPVEPEAIVITNVDGVLTVTTPSGCEWVAVGGGAS